ncbi:MAG: hypothetical protein IKX54_03510 [Lachnospiraceae bacterium]|nr:hypothetical protein [Lachnospiraceae bacterium]
MEDNNGVLQENASGTAAAAQPVSIVSKSGYLTKVKYIGDILGVIISVLLIIGGLSGTMVLRFTSSSTALVVVGFLFLAWDIFSIVMKTKNAKEVDEVAAVRDQTVQQMLAAVSAQNVPLSSPATITVANEKLFLDCGPCLNGVGMTKIKGGFEWSAQAANVRNVLSFTKLDVTALFDITAYSGLEFRIVQEKGVLTVVFPAGVKLVSDGRQ